LRLVISLQADATTANAATAVMVRFIYVGMAQKLRLTVARKRDSGGTSP
jgi:hypothetical protein